MATLDSALFGFLSGLALLVAVGPQTLYVLRQGLSGQHVLPVCTTVVIGDATILTAGATVFNGLSARIESAEVALTLGGAIFVACFGLTALVRATRPAAVSVAGTMPDRPGAATLNRQDVRAAVRARPRSRS